MPKPPLHPALQGLPRWLIRQYNACRLTYGTPDRNGYPRLRWGLESYYAHRVAFEQFWRPLEPGERVYRTCGKRMCTNVYHLTTEAPKKRRKRRPGTAKLNRPKVLAIREVWAGPDRPSQAVLARRYGVSRSAISLVVRGVTWPDIAVPVAPEGSAAVTPPVAPMSGYDLLMSRLVRGPKAGGCPTSSLA